MDKSEYYFRVLQRYDHYINLANTKASNTITLISSLSVAATGLVAWGLSSGGNSIQTIVLNADKIVLIILFILYCGFSLNAYHKCSQVIRPNTTSSTDPNNKYLKTIYYGDVNSIKKLDEFVDLVNQKDEDERFNGLLDQVHTLASITTDKMDKYKKVNFPLFFSFLFLLCILLCSFIIGVR